MTRVNYQSMLNVASFCAVSAASGTLPKWNADAEEFARICGLNGAEKFQDPLLGGSGVFPSSKTIGIFAGEMVKSLTAGLLIKRTPVNVTKASARVTARQGLPAGEETYIDGESASVLTEEVHLVLPSEYSRLDLKTAPLHAVMVDMSRSGVDEIPTVRRSRRMAYGPEENV